MIAIVLLSLAGVCSCVVMGAAIGAATGMGLGAGIAAVVGGYVLGAAAMFIAKGGGTKDE